ncbi:hypothetical protein [Bacillus cereus]|uniref:hypothetical protein n=1 Tax=Bacillus cereus TaxID=1396 RepID=UPI000995C0EE|nr:hypothetical protein [Bacillus cereus]OOZ90067.1 hypothetical protein BHL25_04980 [Bacillus cereus]
MNNKTTRKRQKNTAEMKSNAGTSIYNTKTATGNFLRIPIELNHYQWIDGFKVEMFILFGIIANKYNPKYGYAYPTHYQLMAEYNKSINVLRSHIRKLVEVGLLSVQTANTGNNHCYVPHEPLPQDEFFKKFPCAKRNYDKKMKWIEERERKDHGKLQELHDRFGEATEKEEVMAAGSNDSIEDMSF